jgi:drug/metabolite transporter (DMT)-like permease
VITDALAGLPLPDATVISFLVPTLVGIACAILPALREPFTKIEMISALIAFVGVILIARPSFLKPAIPWLYHDLNVADSTGNLSRAAAVAIALMGICGTSTAYTCLRCIGTRADPLIPVTYFVGFSGLISTVCLVAIPSLPNFMLPTGGFEWALTLGLGFGGFVMQWCLTKGLQTEKGSTGSQIIYVQLVFAVLWELIVWGDLPSIPSLFGILFIIVGIAIANVYKEILPEKEAPDDIIPEEESALLG